MFYKCYYHPKIDGLHSCHGCRLPICDECTNDLTFCPECVEKKAAVAHLRLVRQAQMISGGRQASRSGHLRLALRQVGGGRAQQLQIATAILQGVVDEAVPYVATARTTANHRSRMREVTAKPRQRMQSVPAERSAVPGLPRQSAMRKAFCMSVALLLGLLLIGCWVYHDGLGDHKPLYARQRRVQ